MLLVFLYRCFKFVLDIFTKYVFFFIIVCCGMMKRYVGYVGVLIVLIFFVFIFLFYYLPWLLFFPIPTGLFIGYVSKISGVTISSDSYINAIGSALSRTK